MRELALALALALFILAGAPAPAVAVLLTHAPGGVILDLPDKWNVRDDGGDGTLVVTAPDGDMAVTVSVVESGELATVLKDTLESIEKGVGALKGGDPVNVTINGMKGFVCESRTRDGLIVALLCLVTPRHKAVTIFSASTAASEKKYASEIERIIRGVKPLK